MHSSGMARQRVYRPARARPFLTVMLRTLLFQIVAVATGAGMGLVGTTGWASSPRSEPLASKRLSDRALIREVQRRTFQYFWDGAEPHSGAARERFHVDGDYPDHDAHIVTSGGTGFGVMALLVGIERGFVTRSEAVERLTRIVGFLEQADRFHGAWPHWLEGPTGRVKPFSRNDDGGDLVESAFLVQGLLCVRQYFRDGSPAERALAERIDRLWRGVEWDCSGAVRTCSTGIGRPIGAGR